MKERKKNKIKEQKRKNKQKLLKRKNIGRKKEIQMY